MWILISIFLTTLLRATRGARNLNLQVVIIYASHASFVCSRHSFGLPLRMNGIYRMQLDRSHLGLLSLAFWYACLDHLSRETSAVHSVGVKAFSSSIIVAPTQLLVISSFHRIIYWSQLQKKTKRVTDEKMMTVEWSYLKGALQIQRPLCRASVLQC